MALNGNTLGQEIWDALDAAGYPMDPTALDVWKAVANAIVDHVTANAQVDTNTSSNVVVTSVSGVTTGPGVSGPGAGTATGTGTGTIS